MIRRVRWMEVFAALGCLAIVGAIAFPVYAGGGPRSVRSPCVSNVKQASLGLILYAGDENDRLPPRDAWMDATLPYVKREELWHCPPVPKGAYGYAFNAALSGAKNSRFADPGLVPMEYDSVDPIRNASDLVTSLPLPGRHGRADGRGPGRNTVGYVDGHAKAVPGTPAPKEAPQ